MADDAVAQQQALVAALLVRLCASGVPVALHETHISWVLVAGADAYKIKKAHKLPFLDFSTLERRRHFCEAEARLNAGLAPKLYLGVVDIVCGVDQPRLGGAGQPIEVAVHMRAFPQQALWSERIAHGLLGGDEIDRFAALLVRFHQQSSKAPSDADWGSPQAVAAAGERNLDELIAMAGQHFLAAELGGLRDWQAATASRLGERFAQRKQAGAVRACHGDLHCRNILTLDGEVMAFDCIEFDDALRWIDVMHDLAFTLMDLRQRGEAGLAARLLNGYLEQGGDHDGLAVLRYYEADCALVRAKIALLRAQQAGFGAGEDEATRLIGIAGRSAHPRPVALIMMHGCSGSGKSRLARRLVEMFGAVQLRSDVERRRTPGIDPHCHDAATSDAVYARLRVLAGNVLDAGFPVIVDACHLKHAERQACMDVAAARGAPWLLVEARATPATMRERIAGRRAARADPSEADESVLALQLAAEEALDTDELAHAIVVDTEAPFDAARVAREAARLWPGAP